ncbi:MAG: carbohydrate binding family 9 domain-containing protein [Acidobacteria bacterium]|nr:carbohydrate binding family 9 domain-containing protein [Acidobacteriota bacterium]
MDCEAGKPALVCAFVALWLLAAPLRIWSQVFSASNHKVVYAQRIHEKITVDGNLSEPAWQSAEPAKEFVQREPTEGAPPTEWTEVRFLYDDKNLYIGAYLHESNPRGIVINQIFRDFQGAEQDYFGLVIDPFNDDRNGYEFLVTPVGGQRDTQFFDEGRQNNLSWDGVWYSAGKIHEDYWAAELAIPFKTLRFRKEKDQVWGLHLWRRVRRKNEASFWTPLPRRFTAIRGVALAGELRGIENVEPGRNLYVKPYALAGVERLATRDQKTEGDFDGGVDIKYGLGSGTSLDLTVNTDFSHVEADTQQVNLTRFPLFFPEKREFFQENAGLFQVGAPQGNEALLFHSRTIGLAGGEPIPILGGARLTGRAGNNYLGLLNIQTRSAGSVAATNFTATRFRRDLLANSNVGAIFLNRQSGQPKDHNRAFGVDANFLFFQTDLRISPTLAKTWTPGRQGDDWLGRIEGEWQKALFRMASSYTDIQQNFNPRMGFVRRPGRRIVRNEFELRPRLRQETRLGSILRDISLLLPSQHVLLPPDATANIGSTESRSLAPRLQIEFQDGSILIARYTQNFERLIRPFPIHSGVVIAAGDYRFNNSFLSYASNKSKTLFGTLSYDRGEFYDGEKRTLELEATVRPNYRFSAGVNYERNNVELPAGAFATDLVGFRVNYTFNPQISLSSFIQYNSETDQVSSNIRFRFIHRPLSDIYVVYNEQRDNLRQRTDRAITLKYTHLFSF